MKRRSETPQPLETLRRDIIGLGSRSLRKSYFGKLAAHARAHAVERARAEALAELDRAKTAFFSNVSHEFRTPLTLALGPLEDLLARGEEALPEGAHAQIALAHRNSLRLMRLVNTLLDFSRIEAGRVHAVYQPTDLATLTADLASCFRSACEKAGLRLLVDCPPLAEPVHVDREMWEKIVLNLLSNAFKFTLEGEIEVRLWATGGACELSVRDTGTGIPEAELPRIFERFHRVEGARGRALEGTGIGLALVQELVKLHGGAVRVESTLDRGSVFTVKVPLGIAHLPAERLGEAGELASTAPRPESYVEEALRWLPDEKITPSTSRGAAEQAGVERACVLLADDNADMREYVRRVLAPRFDVEAVPDGQAALESAQRRRPGLVVTDAMMPRLDGFGLLRELRADARLRAVPVILLTARAGEESRLAGLEAGADDYLVKPFSARELLARVTTNLKLARLREEAERERAVRAAAEEAERRSAFLAKAGMLLSESLDYEETLGRLGRFCVQAFADLCVLDLVEGSEIRRLSGACADPAKEPLLERLRQRHPARWGLPHLAARCLRAGAAVSVPELTDELLRSICDDDEHMDLVRAIGIRSLVAVPLVARGQTLGVLSLGSRAPGRYGHADLELAQEVGHRAAIAIDNARLYREAQRAVRMRDEFLVVASHELRTPLTSLALSLRTLRQAHRSGQWATSEAIGELVEIAERQGTRLNRLVDDLLDVSRIELSGPSLHLSQVELGALLRDVVQRFEANAVRARCPVVVRCDAPVVGWWDPSRIDQVVTNLLSNAVKFGAGKPVEILLGQEAGVARLAVRDKGIGIDPDHQVHIFERFGRAVSVQNYGGLGLGLYISRWIVEAHGGSLRVESRPGAGAAFTMELPCAGPKREPALWRDSALPAHLRLRPASASKSADDPKPAGPADAHPPFAG